MSQTSVILATASYDRTIRLWETQTGRCYRTIYYPDSHVNRLEITPDKSRLAAACNPHIQLYDIDSNSYNQPLTTYESQTSNVMAVGFECDGKWMYSGSENGSVKIWDVRALDCQKEYERVSVCRKEYESVSAVNTVVLHPNQNELISGDQNGNISVWDLRADSCRLELVPEVGIAVRSLTVMLDGTMLVAAYDRDTCFVWSLSRGK